MKLNATKLRQNLYKILDQVLQTGEPVEIARHQRTLRIVPDRPVKQGRLSRLTRRKILNEGPEFYDHLEWKKRWGK